jgi:8-oxo-dGTP diphosphatase
MTDWARLPVFGQPPIGAVVTVRPSAYAVLVTDAGEIAVVKAPTGVFLPGGGLEPGETVAAAVVREVREECGLVVAVGAWSTHAVEHVYSDAERIHFEKRSTFCAATLVAPSVVASEADHELTWVTPEKALGFLTPASHRWAVERWRQAAPPQ